jgi:hypothetical protein
MEKQEKYYTSEYIQNQFDKLTKDKKIDVLLSALGYMQQYNGRSELRCIALAMGYRNEEGGINTYTKVKYS